MRFLLVLFLTAMFGASVLAEDDYLPLAIGDEWIMTITVDTPSGNQFEGVAHMKVEEAVQKNGKTYYRVRDWTEGLPQNSNKAMLYRKDEKGLYSLEEGGSDATEELSVLLPLKVGSTWKHAINGKSCTSTVVEMGTVEVLGKSYDKCYHVRMEMEDGSGTDDFWDAPGVSDVKSILTFANGVKATLLLKEFKTGKSEK